MLAPLLLLWYRYIIGTIDGDTATKHPWADSCDRHNMKVEIQCRAIGRWLALLLLYRRDIMADVIQN